MTLGRLRPSVADARDLAEGALRGIGYHNDEARIIADHVIDAAMCGYEYSGLAKILNVFESEHFRLTMLIGSLSFGPFMHWGWKRWQCHFAIVLLLPPHGGREMGAKLVIAHRMTSRDRT